MVTIIGVRFRSAGKIYYFDPGEKKIPRGTCVIVETARGIEMGTVIVPNKEVEEDTVVQPLKPVIRMANEEDFAIVKENKIKQKEAYAICQEKIRKHELEMKLVDVEYTFDNNKILFYFTADGRIDFRELVKDLASVFKTRIELRQIGVRDETKLLGGIGICGRPLCCATYLSDFVPVSIRMAKEQNLSLNPTKISGVCGRLMCCLKNEEETYEYLNGNLPSVGDQVTINEENISGEVQSINVLRQRVKVLIHKDGEDTEIKEVPVSALTFYNKKKNCHQEAEVMNDLEEALDDKDEFAFASDISEAENVNRESGSERRSRRQGRGDRRGRDFDEERSERRARQDRMENAETAESDDPGERRSRQGRGDRRSRDFSEERSERRSRQDRMETAEAAESGEQSERRGRQGRGDRRNRDFGGERGERRSRENGEERSERRSRENGEERSERRSRENGEERSERRSRENGEERGERRSRENGEERSSRRNRQGRGERRDRQERSENAESVNVTSQENGEKSERRGRSEENYRRRRSDRRWRRDSEGRSENAGSSEQASGGAQE